MKSKFIPAQIIVLITISLLYSQKKADFLIVENIEPYAVLDRYEQPLTANAGKQFLPFSPLQIIDQEATLGDEITDVLKFQYDQKPYYFLKNDKGNFVGDTKNRYNQRYKNCALTGDTIQITRAKAVLLAQKYPSKGRRVYCKKGKNCIRIFSYKGYHYVKTIGASAQFGWCSLGARNTWKIVKSTTKKREYRLDTILKDRIVARIEKANKAYRHYFNYFNNLTTQEKSVPQWQYTFGDNMVRCALSGPYKNTGQLEESTYYLVQDLENILIGKSFNVEYQVGEIVITKKD